MKLDDYPDGNGGECGYVNEPSAVETHSKTVDKQKFGILSQMERAGNKAVEDKHDDGERQHEHGQSGPPVCAVNFAVVHHKRYCRHAEQVEQMHAYRQTYNIGYSHKPTVAAGLVDAVFPFQHEPQGEGGAERRVGINFRLHG